MKSVDIKDGEVTGKDVTDGDVTTQDIKDGSLLKGDFAAGQLPSEPSGATGPAGGVLSGTYPAPGLSTAAPGVAIAAVGSPGITVTPTNSVWFNRLGGAPTIVKTADPSAAEYSITFPGLTASTLANVIAVGSAEGTYLFVRTIGGSLFVKRASLAAGPFQVVLYAANPDGGTTP